MLLKTILSQKIAFNSSFLKFKSVWPESRTKVGRLFFIQYSDNNFLDAYEKYMNSMKFKICVLKQTIRKKYTMHGIEKLLILFNVIIL